MMYALVNGHQLLLGPISFNCAMINSELEELEIDYKVNSQDYQSVPILITEDIKILSARYDNPSYDPRFEYLTNVQHEITDTEVIFRHSKATKPLDQVKGEYKSIVKPERQYREQNTTITLTVKDTPITISTSRETRLGLISKLLSNNGPYNFKFDNDIWIEISKEDLEYIISQIDLKVQEAYDWEFAKLAEIDACEKSEDVYSIEIVPPTETDYA